MTVSTPTVKLVPTEWQAEDLEQLIKQNNSANWSQM